MINQRSIKKVNSSRFNKEFVKPLYDSYCFSNLPKFIEWYFSGEGKPGFPQDVFKGKLGKKKILLFLADNFGWRFIEKYQDHPFVKKLIKHGVLSKLTSQFPSTTAVHITTIHTGLSVGESGIYEWFVYEPKIDSTIAPLLFSYAQPDFVRDTLKGAISPEEIYPTQTLYKKLGNKGVNSYIFQYHEYTPSTYSNVVFQGAKIYPYRTLPEAVVSLFEALEQENNRGYFFIYSANMDSINHAYGPESPYSDAETIAFLEVMDKVFWPMYEKVQEETLLVLVADHGHIKVDHSQVFYLDHEIPRITEFVKKNSKGELIIPEGSPRDLFIHVEKSKEKEVLGLLSSKLSGVAEVYTTEELIKEGLFGEKVSKAFLERVGNIVVLPYKEKGVWWWQEGKWRVWYNGHHGGLAPEEVEIGLFLV